MTIRVFNRDDKPASLRTSDGDSIIIPPSRESVILNKFERVLPPEVVLMSTPAADRQAARDNKNLPAVAERRDVAVSVDSKSKRSESR